MSELVREVAIELRGQRIMVRFPNIGQSIRIENLKQALTEGRYAIMAFAGLKTTTRMLNIVDAICYLSVVVPNFYQVLGIDSHKQLLEMDFESLIIVELVKQYRDVYEPFYNILYKRTDRPTVEPKKEEGENTEVKKETSVSTHRPINVGDKFDSVSNATEEKKPKLEKKQDDIQNQTIENEPLARKEQ